MPRANQGLTWACLTQDKVDTPKAKTPLKANNSIAKPVAIHPQVSLRSRSSSQCPISIDHCGPEHAAAPRWPDVSLSHSS